MSDIKAVKHDEVFLRVFCEDSIARELSEYFTFEVPGAKFQPAYKARLWDGRKRLYNLQTKTLYVGLLPLLKNFAKKSNYTLELDEKLSKSNQISQEIIENFLHLIKPCSGGNPLTIRDYQLDAITQAIQSERILLLSPTGSGKSALIYCIMRWYAAQGKKCLLIVPTTSLVEQMYADFEDYANGQWNVEKNVQKIYSGFTKDIEKSTKTVVSTWQSLVKLPGKWFNQFDVVFIDECHLAKANSIVGIMEKTTAVPVKIGTTGTLDGSKCHTLILQGLFCRIHQVTTSKELMDKKVLADLSIKMILLKYDDESRQLVKKMDYQGELDWIVKNEKRNKFIKNVACGTKNNTLLLFQFVEKHGKVLHDMIEKEVGDKRKVFYIHGGVDTAEREEARQIAMKENDCILVCSFQTMSTGVNIPNIETVIFASPSKSKIRNLQSIGRGLRLKGDKTSCELIDIADDLSWKSKANHTLKHASERMKIYTNEEFEYKIIEVNFKC